MDVDELELHSALTEAYIDFVGRAMGENTLEAFRKYQTDAKFKNGIDQLVQVALSTVQKLAQGAETLDLDLHTADAKNAPHRASEGLWEAFQAAVNGGD